MLAQLLNFLGAVLRYFAGKLYSKVTKSAKPSFNQYLNGGGKDNDYNRLTNRFGNIAVALLFAIVIIIISFHL